MFLDSGFSSATSFLYFFVTVDLLANVAFKNRSSLSNMHLHLLCQNI